MTLILIKFCCSAETDPQGVFSLVALSWRATIGRASARAVLSRRTIQSLTGRPLADEGERTPERRIGVSGRRRVVEIGQHGLTQRLGAAQFWIGLETIEGRCGEPGGGFRIDRPVRDQQRPGPGIEE